MFDIEKIVRENNINTEILDYFYNPDLFFDKDGNKITVVRIINVENGNLVIRCPNVERYINENVKPEIIEEKMSVKDFFNYEKNSLNIKFMKLFCEIPEDKIRNNDFQILKLRPKVHFFNSPKLIGSFNNDFVTNFFVLSKEFVEKNDLVGFVQFCADIYSTEKNKHRKHLFCRTTFLIKTFFEIARYDYLVSNELIQRNPYSEKVIYEKWKGIIDLYHLWYFDFFLNPELYNDYSIDHYFKIKFGKFEEYKKRNKQKNKSGS